jgi:hypothetical protein
MKNIFSVWLLLGGLLATTLVSSVAFAQTSQAANSLPAASSTNGGHGTKNPPFSATSAQPGPVGNALPQAVSTNGGGPTAPLRDTEYKPSATVPQAQSTNGGGPTGR